MGTLISFAAGLLFGLGLLLSGMTDPERVLAFLDVAGHWNPALALVMGGAIAVSLPAFAYARRHGKALTGETIRLPDRSTITPRLLSGSVLFGVGWGLSGICPGPAIVIAASGRWQPLLFLLSMAAGMVLYTLLFQAPRRPQQQTLATPPPDAACG